MPKSTAKYTLLPDNDEEEGLLSNADLDTPGLESNFPPAVDPRFVQQTPSLWKRIGLLVLILFSFLLFFAFQLMKKGRGRTSDAETYP
ncbi:hypothetical protein K438DRAFT_2019203 [Mycena galopus ATCC 62051]|nr:hypothetical protein K438DRAFT_2019203 [Mycena galopus ATCC 62051]